MSVDDPNDQIQLEEENRIVAARFWKILQKDLSENEFQVMYMTMEQRPTREIAAKLNLSETNVRTIRSRVHKRVKEEYGDLL